MRIDVPLRHLVEVKFIFPSGACFLIENDAGILAASFKQRPRQYRNTLPSNSELNRLWLGCLSFVMMPIHSGQCDFGPAISRGLEKHEPHLQYMYTSMHTSKRKFVGCSSVIFFIVNLCKVLKLFRQFSHTILSISHSFYTSVSC